MFWMLPLALAAAGALADKKNPIRGAALGAGVGMTGGLLAGPAAAGAAGGAAAGAAGTAATPGLLDVGATLGGTQGDLAAMNLSSGSTGLLGGIKTAAGYAKPAMQAMNAASQAQGLLGNREPPMQAPGYQPPMTYGPQALSALAQQNTQEQMALEQAAQMRRQRRVGLLGGGNGLA